MIVVLIAFSRRLLSWSWKAAGRRLLSFVLYRRFIRVFLPFSLCRYDLPLLSCLALRRFICCLVFRRFCLVLPFVLPFLSCQLASPGRRARLPDAAGWKNMGPRMKTRHQKIGLPLSRQKFYASFSRGTVQAQKNGWPSGAAGFSSIIYAKKIIKKIFNLVIIFSCNIYIIRYSNIKAKKKEFKADQKAKKAKGAA